MRTIVFLYLCPLLYLATSCRPKAPDVSYSPYEAAGTARLTVIVDSVPVDQATIYSQFYMEFVTPRAVFLVKPDGAQNLTFPKLQDSLTEVRVYYSSFFDFSASGPLLREQYRSLYLPDEDSLTFILDTYPFTEPRARKWPKPDRKMVYFELRSRNHRLFGTEQIRAKLPQ